MIDLGFVTVPFDVINWMIIVTACILAAMYIGFEVLSAIGGTIMVALSLRSLLSEEPMIVVDYDVGVFGALLILFVGVYLAYRGTVGFMSSTRG